MGITVALRPYQALAPLCSAPLVAAPATDEGAKFVGIIRLLAVLFAESAHPHPPRSSAPSPSWGRLITCGGTDFVRQINHNLQLQKAAFMLTQQVN